MGFKIGMLGEACNRKMLVFDNCRKHGIPFAYVFFDKETQHFFLRYLDGFVALLVRDEFNQMEPTELCRVQTKEEISALDKFLTGSMCIPVDQVMFGADLIPQSSEDQFFCKPRTAQAESV